jgi:hypothetical protein
MTKMALLALERVRPSDLDPKPPRGGPNERGAQVPFGQEPALASFS